MDYSQGKKTLMLAPAATLTGATNSSALDTLDGNFAVIDVAIGAITGAMTALKLQESDDNSTWADVSGDYPGDFSAASDGQAAALPGDADDNKMVAIFVDCRGRKRYLRVTLTPGTNAFVTITGTVHALKQGVLTASDRGLLAFRHVQ